MELDSHPHADRKILWRNAHHVGQHLIALVQRDDRRRVGRLEPRRDGTMDHGPAVDLADAVARLPAQLGRKTLPAVLRRRKVRETASLTTLIAQLFRPAALPERNAQVATRM